MTMANEGGALSRTSILDCTLRDGGYYTAWDFEQSIVDEYLAAVARLPVDVVELGYVNASSPGYKGKYYFLDRATTEHARRLLRPDQRLAVMFDEKSVAPSDVPGLLEDLTGIVDLVRIAVAPSRIAQAVDLAKEIKRTGLQVGLNVMYLSQYWQSPEELPHLSQALATVDSLALVDSYGSCLPDQVASAVATMVNHTDVAIGFHGHENLGLALANSLVAADAGAQIVDGTMRGMGRGPGNARTELLLIHQASMAGEELDHAGLDRALTPFEDLQSVHGWGTNLVYMVSGAAGLPQNDVMDWLGKNRYSAAAIVGALKGAGADSLDVTPYPPAANLKNDAQEVVILGGGSSVQEHLGVIERYVTERAATVLHATYRHLEAIAAIPGTHIVCAAGDATMSVEDSPMAQKAAGIIVPIGPRHRGTTPSDPTTVHEARPFAAGATEKLGPVSDVAPLALALGAALELGAESVTLLGFDGYADANTAQQELASEVQDLIYQFTSSHPQVTLTSGTRTRYDIPVESLYSRLAGSRQRA